MKPMYQWPTGWVVTFGFATGVALVVGGMAFAWGVLHLIRIGALPMP